MNLTQYSWWVTQLLVCMLTPSTFYSLLESTATFPPAFDREEAPGEGRKEGFEERRALTSMNCQSWHLERGVAESYRPWNILVLGIAGAKLAHNSGASEEISLLSPE